MRSDKQLNPRFAGSQNWTHDRGPGGQLTNLKPNPEGSEYPYTAFSHSGSERNRLFLNQRGETFTNVSGVSGADSILDGRSFVHWDFNRDGRPDLGLVNANEQLLQIFENQITHDNHFLALRLTGDPESRGPSGRRSTRDAIGAVVTVHAGKEVFMRTLSCGEGFASQNSRLLLIGIGRHKKADAIKIDWPSGHTTELQEIKANRLISVSQAHQTAKTANYYLDEKPRD